ncbi:hypothetical protein [Streptomyces sp. NPDC059788]|uniref:hypothetical protein n=1 Tax=Streptomyces sp. NPDC059788 TaxID=3346948 RepID=UPI00366195C3
MAGTTDVDPAELRSAAQAEDAVADDMKGANDKALADARAAADSLDGWSFGAALRTVAESWAPALNGMHDRAKAGAANLRKSAEGHEWNDSLVSQDFEKAADPRASTASAVSAMSVRSTAGGGDSGGGGTPGFTRLTPPAGPALPRTGGPRVDPMPVYEPDVVGGPAPDPHPELRPQRSGSPFG